MTGTRDDTALLVTPLSGSFPFAHALVHLALAPDDVSALRPYVNCLCPLLEATPPFGLVRFPKKTDLLARLRVVCRALADALHTRGVGALTFRAEHLDADDRQFLDELLSMSTLTVSYLPPTTVSASEDSSHSTCPLQPDAREAPIDSAVMLANGNPWAVIRLHRDRHTTDAMPSDTRLDMARAFVMLDDPLAAMGVLATAEPDDAISRSRALYEEAMLWLRHLPKSMRDAPRAASLLASARELLAADTREGDLDRALQRALLCNAEALSSTPDDAAGLLEDALATVQGLMSRNPSNCELLRGTSATLLANLAQVRLRQLRTGEAVELLTEASRLDPSHLGYSCDLLALSDHLGPEQLGLIYRKLSTHRTFDAPSAIALANYHSNRLDHVRAAQLYEQSLVIAPWFEDVRVQAAQEWCAADEPAKAELLLDQVQSEFLTASWRARFELLVLEVESLAWTTDVLERVHARLSALRDRYPQDELIDDNLRDVERQRDQGLPNGD